MPFGKEGKEHGVGVALSDGGFRATLFHVGALWRINELALLPKIDRISSISGGSIVAGLLAKEWNELDFQGGIAADFERRIVDPLRDFCRRAIDIVAIGQGLLSPWRTVRQSVQERY